MPPSEEPQRRKTAPWKRTDRKQTMLRPRRGVDRNGAGRAGSVAQRQRRRRVWRRKLLQGVVRGIADPQVRGVVDGQSFGVNAGDLTELLSGRIEHIDVAVVAVAQEQAHRGRRLLRDARNLTALRNGRGRGYAAATAGDEQSECENAGVFHFKTPPDVRRCRMRRKCAEPCPRSCASHNHKSSPCRRSSTNSDAPRRTSSARSAAL